jgi:hypothetical protein
MRSIRRGTALLGILLVAGNVFAAEQLADLSENSLPVLNETLRKLSESARRSPTIYTGTAAPTTVPQKKGDIFLRTDTGKVYVATGTDTSADWKLLN